MIVSDRLNTKAMLILLGRRGRVEKRLLDRSELCLPCCGVTELLLDLATLCKCRCHAASGLELCGLSEEVVDCLVTG